MRFSSNFSWKFLLLIFCIFIAVSEVNNKFPRKNSYFQGVSSALEKTSQIPALFKEFNDLHER